MPLTVKFDPNPTQQQGVILPDATLKNDGIMTKEMVALLLGGSGGSVITSSPVIGDGSLGNPVTLDESINYHWGAKHSWPVQDVGQPLGTFELGNVDTDGLVLRITPGEPGASVLKWQQCIHAATNTGSPLDNQNMGTGWNMRATGPEDGTLPAGGWHFESHFQPAGDWIMENHVAVFIDPNMGGTEIRVFDAVHNFTTGLTDAGIQCDRFSIELPGGGPAFFQILTATTPVLNLSNSFVIANQDNNVSWLLQENALGTQLLEIAYIDNNNNLRLGGLSGIDVQFSGPINGDIRQRNGFTFDMATAGSTMYIGTDGGGGGNATTINMGPTGGQVNLNGALEVIQKFGLGVAPIARQSAVGVTTVAQVVATLQAFGFYL